MGLGELRRTMESWWGGWGILGSSLALYRIKFSERLAENGCNNESGEQGGKICIEDYSEGNFWAGKDLKTKI